MCWRFGVWEIYMYVMCIYIYGFFEYINVYIYLWENCMIGFGVGWDLDFESVIF